MYLIGVMRLCDEFVEAVEQTILQFYTMCDDVCFLTNELKNPTVLSAVLRCPNVLGIQEYKQDGITKYNHYRTTDAAYHFANSFGPDWVLICDQDELYPPQLRQGIDVAVANDVDAVALGPLNCWGTPDRIVWPRLNKTGRHVKLHRGGRSTFSVRDGGGCGHAADQKGFIHWPYPFRHMHMMTASCRARRRNVPSHRTRTEPWCAEQVPTIPYNPEWTWQRYLAVTREDCEVTSG